MSSKSTTSTTQTTTIKKGPGGSTTTSIIPVGSCLSPLQDVPLKNGDFATGDYSYWNATGTGFGTAPFNLTAANQNGAYYNHTWEGYNGTFVATTYEGGINVEAGNLTSHKFEVIEPYLNFKIVSPENNDLYIQILSSSDDPLITTHYNTYAARNNTFAPSQFVNASIALSAFLCQNVSIKVVASVVGGAADREQYIAVGDFTLGKTPVQTPGIIVS